MLDGGLVLGLVGAGALLLFGGRLLALGPRAGPALVLGLFAVFWAVQISLVRLWAVEQPQGRAFLLASTAFLVPLYFLLGHFAAVFPRRLAMTASRAWLPLLALPALAWLVAIALDPSAAVYRTDAQGPVFGWAVFALQTPALIGAMVFALARFAVAHLRARDALERQQMRLCTLAMLVYVAYWLGALAAGAPQFWPALVAQSGLAVAAVYFAFVSTGLVALGLTAAYLVRGTVGRERWLWLAATVLPATAAFLTSRADPAGGALGLFRLAMVSILAYGVAKFHLLNVDLRLRSTAPLGATAALGFAVWGVLAALAFYTVGARWPEDPAVFLSSALAGLLAAFLARRRIARFFDEQFPYIRASEEYLLRRRIEVYRAASENDTPRAQLDVLARDLKLKAGERGLIDRTRAARVDGPTAAPGGLLGGRYQLERPLAEGLFGGVVLARDMRLGERVVVKEYRGFGDPQTGQSFAREAKALGELEHPHIITVRDVFRAADDAYVVLEYAGGGSLEDWLRTQGKLPEEAALHIAAQVLAALAEAHQHGIVHRDVKPANILFQGQVAKLADFGTALDPVLDGAFRAASGSPGTLGWMAPEQARGERATKASDVHAAGAVLYRMLAGRHYLPLEGMTESAARRAIVLRAPALPLPGVSQETNELLATALAKDPAVRYADAAAMRKDLSRLPKGSARSPGAAPTLSLMAPPGHEAPREDVVA